MGCARSRMRSRRFIGNRYSPFYAPPAQTHVTLGRGFSAALDPLPSLDSKKREELFLQGANVSHQSLNLFRLQLIRVLGHLVLAVRDDPREIGVRHLLHFGSRKIMAAHFLSHGRAGSVGTMAHDAF